MKKAGELLHQLDTAFLGEHVKMTSYFRAATHFGLHLTIIIIITQNLQKTQVGRVSKNQCPKSQVLFFFFPYPTIT